MLVLLSSMALFLLYLIHERISLARRIPSIPLRITVTGTRGKSSVTRMMASILREDGRRVLAKTTGSEARTILPGGEEIDIPRRGIVSIIEQKKFIKQAADLNADSVVAEIMSIHPENHHVESHKLLKPNIVVITNVRRDHIDAMGETEEEIASIFCLDIPEKATVFVLEKEKRHVFQATVEEMGGELVEVESGISSSIVERAPELVRREFVENIDLVYSLGRHLGIDEEVITRGILTAEQDIGAIRIWEYRSKGSGKLCYLVNAFAANDPESTLYVISKVREVLPEASGNLVGLLCLRADRGDRTLQWIEALANGMSGCFSRVYVTGGHARVVNRKLAGVHLLRNRPPEKMMESIMAEVEDRAVVFGCGNIVGTGQQLVDYWNRAGAVYGL